MRTMTGIQLLTLLFARSSSVTCVQCGRELKGESLQRLVRRGCPACGSKETTFHGLPPALAQRLQDAVGKASKKEQAPCTSTP